MISKKVLFPLAAVAMASFVACGDDSSSGSPSSDAAPASIQKFEEIDDVACSQTANLCAKVYLVEHNDTLQCNGTQWNTMINGQPVAGCENAAPVANDSAAQEPAAQDPAANDPAAQDPADPGAGEEPAGPGAGEEPAGPGAGEEPAGPGAGEEPATGTVGCMKAGVCSEGPAALASECSAEEGEELLDACPAGGEVCDIGEDGITMYFYADAAMSCDDYKAMIAAFSEMAQ
ncbi:MAG: hypothetical protein IKO21_07200 [Fibrobacter sp.]|nr:hypothetical protein [Fibrobacter sp.]